MAKYVNRPVRIEAALYDGKRVGEPHPELPDQVMDRTCPDWFPAVTKEVDHLPSLKDGEVVAMADRLIIGAHAGHHGVAFPGHWIILLNGRLYAMPPQDFHARYQREDA